MQAHDQLMAELELSSLANGWRTTRLQRCALHCWRANAAESVQQRLREAAHQQTWSRVRGWLSELDGGQQGPTGAGPAGLGTETSAEGVGGAGAGAGAGYSVGVGTTQVDVSGWDLDVDSEGFEGGIAAGRTDASATTGQLYQQQCDDCDVDGDLGGMSWAEGLQDGDDVVDLDALADWFDAAERGIHADTVG